MVGVELTERLNKFKKKNLNIVANIFHLHVVGIQITTAFTQQLFGEGQFQYLVQL